MRLFVTAALVLLIAAVPGGAAAQPATAPDDRVVIKGPVRVERGETAEDVVVIDGPVRISGRVRGDLVVVRGVATIRGRVDGDVLTVADRATLAAGARVGGDFGYVAERPRISRRATVGGEVKRANPEKAAAPLGAAGAAAFWLAVSVSALALGLLLLWLAPRAAEAVLETGRTRLGASIGLGVALFIGLPILAVLALVTVVGIPLGVALLLVLLPLYWIGYASSAWLLGRRLVRPPRHPALAFLAGLAILRLLALVPFLGGLVWLAATVLGLGALFLTAWRARRPEAAGPASAAGAMAPG
ncbi:MAG: polymer-forming cytoskeletal protein [Actinomycetota bacterium]|nr:polymer-forming cytoskeletal protein [Actinomycetota bacterium]